MKASVLVSAWNTLVQHLNFDFTRPTARTWQVIALGWVLHRGPATVTGIIRAAGGLACRHWTVYHKFFYRTAWSLDDLWVRLAQTVIHPMIVEAGQRDARTGEPVVDLHIDDTTTGRYGRHVAYAGWYKDASCNGPAYRGTVIHWAHNWIVAAVTLRLPGWPLMRWALPVMTALYRKRPDCTAEHPFRTRQQMAATMVRQAAKALPAVRWRVCADGQYATHDMVKGLPETATLVSRIRRDAALYEQPSGKRRPGCRRGPVPRKGRRLPAPKALATRTAGWKTIEFQSQGRTRQRQVLGITCLWPHVCGHRPVRVVIVRDPSGRQKDDYFFCTDATVDDAEIVQRAMDRWGVEEVIQEAKQQMGFESTRGWCSRTVRRQAPLALILVTLVKAWYAKAALQDRQLLPQAPPWNQDKAHPSFADMLSALRWVLVRHRISANSGLTRKDRKFLEAVAYVLCRAA